MTRWCGWLLIATGIGHAAVGLVLFRHPVADVLREGIVNTVRGQYDREAAFWFLLFSPVCVVLGHRISCNETMRTAVLRRARTSRSSAVTNGASRRFARAR
jgi:hypothetical protein